MIARIFMELHEIECKEKEDENFNMVATIVIKSEESNTGSGVTLDL